MAGERSFWGRLRGQMFRDGEGVPRDLRLAEIALTRGCNGGKSYACHDLGFMALGLYGVKPDFALAAQFLKRACDGDHGNACGSFGVMQEFGLGTAKNMDSAVAAYHKACRLDAADCAFLAQAIQQGRGRTANGPEPVALFRKACGAGSTSACAMVRTYFDARQPLNPAHAAEFMTYASELCRNGVPRSCTSVGIVAGAQGKVREGAALIERACSMGDEWACIVAKFKKAP